MSTQYNLALGGMENTCKGIINRSQIYLVLSPNDDQHQYSPNNIPTLLKYLVMRINKMITKEKIP